MTPANAISSASALDIGAVQAALRTQGLDGWLLYDFRGSNAIAVDIAGVGRQGGHLTTRRWYYLIPASGEPRALVHAIESHSLEHLPGTTERYSGRAALESGLQRLLQGMRRIAMEYSPKCAIPYVSRVDAGTIELVRQFNVEVVSSGDLVQQFSAVWNDAQTRTHVAASEKLYRVKDRAFDEAARRLKDGATVTEFEIQQLMAGWFAEEGLVSDSAPVVAAEKNAGDPHYLPTASATRTIGKDEVLLLDLWGKLDQPGAVFADITWVGYTGREVPARIVKAFARGRGRARRGGRSRAAADPGRPGDPRLRGRPRVDGRPARHAGTATPSCTARATASGRRCTATASTWTTTRPTTIGGCCPARGSRSSRACTSRISGSDRKST